MICSQCGRDLDEIGQDNMSMAPGFPLCEDCANENDQDIKRMQIEAERKFNLLPIKVERK